MAAKSSLPHLVWAAGHGLVLLGTAYTLTNLITFKGGVNKSYYIAYTGALISWGIVVYKSLGVPQLTKAYLQRALLDENVQYLILALFWYLQKPIYVTLIPFATFSLFHVLTFLRTTVLPKPAPSTKGATGSSSSSASAPAPTGGAKLSKTIQSWVKSHYEQAMLFVAFVEVLVVFGRVLLGAILLRNSLFAPIFYAHFLRLRYYLSPPTRQAFAYVSDRVDNFAKSSSCPPPLRKVIETGKAVIVRYAESVIQVGNPPAAAAGAGGAGGARAAGGAQAARPAGGNNRN